MTLIQAAFLGLVQGLTEFLPVSSSGHLVILQKVLGFTEPPVGFDVTVHVGTLVVVLVYFWKDIRKANTSLIAAIVVGSIPTLMIGVLLEKISDLLFNNLTIVGVALLGTSALLTSTILIKKRIFSKKTPVDFKTALIIGTAQGLAIIPGISRSASTIVSGLWSGLKREEAVRFAFLLSIPAIIGAQLMQLTKAQGNAQIPFLASTVGFFAAAIAGWFSLNLLKAIVVSAKLHRFALYTAALALLLLFS